MTTNPNTKNKIKKYLVYTGIALIGCLLIYLVFKPENDNTSSKEEFDLTLPDPEEKELPSKEDAYIEDDHSALISNMFSDLDDELDLLSLETQGKDSTNEAMVALERAKNAKSGADNTVLSLAQTVNSANNNEDEEKQNKIEELEERLRIQEGELKIMQARAGLGLVPQPQQEEKDNKNRVVELASTENAFNNNEQPSVMPVGATEIDVVSALNQAGRHNKSFYGINNLISEQKNTMKATVFGTQVIGQGQNLRIRLSEPIQVGQQILPANSIVVAKCQIDDDRLYASINTIECQGIITNVSLEVYDAVDKQPGLCLPNSLEQDAIREIGADVATSVGAATSQSISVFSSEPNAAEQIKTDVGRGLISGVSKFASRKLMEINVTVQDSHRILLVSKK